LSKITLNTITNSVNISAINDNFAQIATQLNDEVLYRANPVGEPNQMENALDMNANDILNGGKASFTDITVNGTSVEGSVSQAGAYALQAQGYANAASLSSSNANNSATAAAASAASASSTLTNALVKTNNLSDVSNVVTARSNMGLGSGNVPTFSNVILSASTAHGVVIGNGASGLSYTAAGTAGLPLLSGGASADPSYGTLGIAGGGTGGTTQATARTGLGLGTAAVANTGTSGGVVPFLNGNNTWGAGQTFSVPCTFAGVVSGSNPASGNIGEIVTFSSAVSGLTNGTPTTIQTAALGAGIWDIENVTYFQLGAGCALSVATLSVSQTNNTHGALPNQNNIAGVNITQSNTGAFVMRSGLCRITSASSFTAYGVVSGFFSGGTCQVTTYVICRRVA
jgi:hypothetical protein